MKGGGKRGEVFLCKLLSACMCSLEEWICSSCPLCHCSLGAVAKKNVFIVSLMRIERMKPRPTDAKVYAIKFSPTHIVFFFDLEIVWHLRYHFSAGT